VTRTRYPGNPDWYPVPPRCHECGRFVGDPVHWETVNPLDDLPVFYEALCSEHAPPLELPGEA
jgi:hypothetical protein